MFKNLFKESGLPIIEISVWIMLIASFVLTLMIFRANLYNFEIKGFAPPLETIKVNLESDNNNVVQNLMFCFNSTCTSMAPNSFLTYYRTQFDSSNEAFYKEKIKELSFAYPVENTDLEKNIRNFDIHIGNKNYYYTKDDIKKFQKHVMTIELDNGKKQKYNVLTLPEVTNYTGIFPHLFTLFLSLFYNWQYFIVPYLWIFIAGLFYIFKKDKFKLKTDFKFIEKYPYIILTLIILSGIYLRLCAITYYPLWMDEVYTKAVALFDFKSCFCDPGNPPLFFIVDFIFNKIAPNSDFALRFPSFIFGVLSIPLSFVLFKKFNIKNALFLAFFASINIINIYHSQEARGYSLSMLLILSSIYLLFKYLEKPDTKNLILYGVIAVFAINNNYYLILFAFSNFIWGIVDLIQNKNKNQILKFVLTNFIAFLSFVPYYIISSHNALSGGFNEWIPKLSKEVFLYVINFYFVNKYIFLFLCIILLISLILCYLPKNLLQKLNLKINPDKENLFIYLIYTIVFVLILASLISIFIKPIVHKRVLLSIYGLLFLLEGLCVVGVAEFQKCSKILTSIKYIYTIAVLAIFALIAQPAAIREVYNTNDFMNFIKNDIKNYPSDYEFHALTTDDKLTIDIYPEVKKLDNIKWHFFNANNGNYLNSIKKSDYTSKDKNVVIYFNAIGVDTGSLNFISPHIYIYGSNLTPYGKAVY